MNVYVPTAVVGTGHAGNGDADISNDKNERTQLSQIARMKRTTEKKRTKKMLAACTKPDDVWYYYYYEDGPEEHIEIETMAWL